MSPSISPSSSVSPSPSPGFAEYTREASGSLPADDTDLATAYTEAEIDKTTRESNQDVDVEDDIGQTGTGYLLHQFKSFIGAALAFGIEFSGESTLSLSSNPAFLQIYNHTTNLWETIATSNMYPPEITFELTGSIPGSTKYVNADNVISVRVYQYSATQATFAVDLYRVLLPAVYTAQYSGNPAVYTAQYPATGSRYTRKYPPTAY